MQGYILNYSRFLGEPLKALGSLQTGDLNFCVRSNPQLEAGREKNTQAYKQTARQTLCTYLRDRSISQEKKSMAYKRPIY